MSTFKFLDNNFTAGKISKLLSRRSDFAKFKNGLSVLTNFFSMIQGGITSRTGSVFVAGTKTGSSKVRLRPFKYNTDQAYTLEFGNEYIRFYKDSGLILNAAQSITAISKANPAVVTYSGADNFTAGDHVYITGVVGMTEINDDKLFYTVGTVDTATNTFTIKDRDGVNVNSSSFTTYTSGGSIYKVYEISSPYQEADLRYLDYSQSGDQLFITHKSYDPKTLSRINDLSWTLANTSVLGVDFTNDTHDFFLEVTRSDGVANILYLSGYYKDYTLGTGGYYKDAGLFLSSDVGQEVTVKYSTAALQFTFGTETVTLANPGVFTKTAHGLVTGDEVFVNAVEGSSPIQLHRIEGRPYTVVKLGANTFSLKLDGVDVDTSAYTAFTANRFYIWKKSALSTITGTVSTVYTAAESGYRDAQITLTLGAVTPAQRIGTTIFTTPNYAPGYLFPDKNTFFQQRWIFTRGEKIYGSEVDNYNNFAAGTNDADPLQYTIATGEVNNIKWISGASKQLRIGTENGILTLAGGGSNNALTPTAAIANTENNIRCKELKPIDLGNTNIAVQRSGKTIREVYYDFNSDTVIAPDLSVLSEDILGDKGDRYDEGVIELAYQQEPYPILYALKADGTIAACVYDKEQNVVAWSDLEFGSGVVESICVVPTEGQDRVWLAIKRTIDGTVYRYIEKLDLQFRNRAINTAIFSDCHSQYEGDKPQFTLTPDATEGNDITFTASGAAFTSNDVGRYIESNGSVAIITAYTDSSHVVADIITEFSGAVIATDDWNLSINSIDGLDYLEGETVVILGNGGVVGYKSVTNGAITLDGEYNYVGIGLAFNRIMQTVDIDIGSVLGTAYGSRCKIDTSFLEFYETVGGSTGFSESTLSPIIFRDGNDIIGAGLEPQTVTKEDKPRGGWQDVVRTRYENYEPLPVTILSATIKGMIHE